MVTQRQNGSTARALLAEAASLWGVNLEYRDATGRMRASPERAVFEVLGALAPRTVSHAWSETDGDAPLSALDLAWLREAIEDRRVSQRDRLLEPVLVAWDGVLTWDSSPGVKVTLETEDGGRQQIGAGRHRIAYGHHRLRAESGRRIDEGTLISAPRRCWQAEGDVGRWGVFSPAYALRSERDWGAGDLTEVQTLLQTVSDAGGSAVAVLPMLAAYLDRPFECSPYSPVSRLFWNEFYLAVEQLPEWSGCGSARAIRESPKVREKVTSLRGQDVVDYAEVMALKRRVLERLSAYFFRDAGSLRREDLAAFVCERPEVLAYADFRARVETHGGDWRYWPSDERSSQLESPGVGGLSEAGRYHLYVQWQMERQLSKLSGRLPSNGDAASRDIGAGLFLDVPVGVHPGGFDVWSRPEEFVRGMSIGAPPDAFFSEGQYWESPPLHPEEARQRGHSYWRQVLRHHMRFASRLRLDHVMSLHRLFWIPEGREPREGVYVDYPAAELYAVLCLESHRHRTAVAGEDLGTVPAGVRSGMRSHGMSRTWVLQAALHPRSSQVVEDVPRGAVATLGTHDMFPLAGFVRGDDITESVRAARKDEEEARRELAARRRLVARMTSFLTKDGEIEDPAAIVEAALSYLGASSAALTLVDLADLLLQTRPHNVPGTGLASANWRRKVDADEEQIRRVVHRVARLLQSGQVLALPSSSST